MDWNEADLLTQELARDPSSRVGAALAGLKYPFSQEAFILADTFDQYQMSNLDKKNKSKFKPYPRPVEAQTSQARKSKKPTVTQAEINAALAQRGH